MNPLKTLKKVFISFAVGFTALFLFAIVPATNNQYIAPKRFIQTLDQPLETIHNLNDVNLNQKQRFIKETIDFVLQDEAFLQTSKQRFLPYTKTEYDFTVPIQYFIIIDLFVQIQQDDVASVIQQIAIQQVDDTNKLEDQENKQDKQVNHQQKDPLTFARDIKQDHAFYEDLKNIDAETLAAFFRYYDYLNGTDGVKNSQVIKLKDGEIVYPFENYFPISATIGWYRPFGKNLYHDGVDLAAGCGEKTYNVMEGYVVAIYAKESPCGNGLEVLGKNGIKVKYCHFQNQVDVSIGSKLEKGDLVGYVGTTGFSTGCHLHIAVKQNTDIFNFCEMVSCYP